MTLVSGLAWGSVLTSTTAAESIPSARTSNQIRKTDSVLRAALDVTAGTGISLRHGTATRLMRLSDRFRAPSIKDSTTGTAVAVQRQSQTTRLHAQSHEG